MQCSPGHVLPCLIESQKPTGSEPLPLTLWPNTHWQHMKKSPLAFLLKKWLFLSTSLWRSVTATQNGSVHSPARSDLCLDVKPTGPRGSGGVVMRDWWPGTMKGSCVWLMLRGLNVTARYNSSGDRMSKSEQKRTRMKAPVRTNTSATLARIQWQI